MLELFQGVLLQIGVIHWQLVGQIAVYSVHMNEDELCVSAPEMVNCSVTKQHQWVGAPYTLTKQGHECSFNCFCIHLGKSAHIFSLHLCIVVG